MAEEKKRKMRVVLLGPPGCGKGTVAEMLESELGMRHVSTGDLLRGAVAKGTPAGLTAKDFMSRGLLVPDDTVVQVLADNLLNGGGGSFVLDGFPRTIQQAETLDGLLEEHPLTHLIIMEVDEGILKKRICGRLVHPASGRSYHTETRPPREPMRDDLTGEPLVRRPDDTEEALQRRLVAYHEQTEPLISYYKTKNVAIVCIDAGQSVSGVSDQLRSKLKC